MPFSIFYLDGETVLNALKKVFYDPPIEPCDCEPQTDFLELPYQTDNQGFRRTSGASSVSGNFFPTSSKASQSNFYA